MSNYQARRRAIRAERAALRCEQLVDEMREQCRRRQRQIWEEARERFDMEHASMVEQHKALLDIVVQSRKCDAVGLVLYAEQESGK